MSVDGTVTGETVTEEAKQGSTIALTIDSKLQQVAENALKNNISIFCRNYSKIKLEVEDFLIVIMLKGEQ